MTGPDTSAGYSGTDIGGPGIELVGERTGIVAVARQYGFQIVDRARKDMFDDPDGDGPGIHLEALLEGQGQVHLDL